MAARTGTALFEGIAVLLIDGNNVLHRVAGRADPVAQRLLIPRIRAAVPSSLATVFMLDGPSDAGTASRVKIGTGFEARHSGTRSADEALLTLIREQPPGARHQIALVTDDIALTNRARLLGAHTRRLSWLQQLLDGPSPRKASIGAGRPTGRSDPRPFEADYDQRTPWQPGRGATRKRGNPRRGRSDRDRRSPQRD
jgi:hypothetical protein